MAFSELNLKKCKLKDELKDKDVLSLGNPFLLNPRILNTIPICKENKKFNTFTKAFCSISLSYKKYISS